MKTETEKAKNREAMRLTREGLKKCRKCGEIKPLDQFTKVKRYTSLCNACKQKKHDADTKKRREKALDERCGQIKCRKCGEYRDKHFFSIDDLRYGRYSNLTCISCKSLNEPPLIEPQYDKIIRINNKIYVEVAYVGEHKCAHCAIDNDFICQGIDCNNKYFRRYNGYDINAERNYRRRNLNDKFNQKM